MIVKVAAKSGRLLAGAVCVAALAAAGCRSEPRSRSEVDLASFRRLGPGEVAALSLVKVDSVSLGTSDRDVSQITDLKVWSGRYYVLDGATKSVRVFDHRGRLTNTIGRQGRGPGEFVDPAAIAFQGERMLVADPGAGNRLSVFEKDGRFAEEVAFHTPTAPVAVATAGDRVVTMGVMVPSGTRPEDMNALAVSSARGDVLGRGCAIDPRYVESRERDGVIAHYDFGSLSTDGARMYCTQSITPVVQVMDRAGHAVRQIRLAPPFYVPPHDRKLSMNQKAIFDFMSSFTSHVRLFPLADGFVSVYSRFDPATGENRYHLFVCRGASEARCGVARNVGKPLYMDAAERVYVEEPIQLNRPARIGIYRIVSAAG